MNPYIELGLTHLASLEEAKQAFRRLAQQHHPDKGGDESKFKTIKAAWEQIQAGWAPPPPPPPPVRSSFSPPPKSSFTQPTKARSTPYQAPRRIRNPEAKRRRPQTSTEYEVTLHVTDRQAAMGVHVPFECGEHTVSHWVAPGTWKSYTANCNIYTDPVIGSQFPKVLNVTITLIITPETKE